MVSTLDARLLVRAVKSGPATVRDEAERIVHAPIALKQGSATRLSGHLVEAGNASTIGLANSSSTDDEHVARKLGQPIEPAGTGVQGEQVLDPDTGLALEIDPGLDAEDRRRRQGGVGGAAAERGQLVGRQADPVAEPVAVGRPAAVASITSLAISSRSRTDGTSTSAPSVAVSCSIAARCAAATSS